MVVVATVLVLLGACSSGGTTAAPPATAPARLKVVASTDILGAVTRQILGDQADVTVLMSPGTDPHTFTPSAEQSAAMNDAGIIVTVGLGLEKGMKPALDDARRRAVTVLEIGPQLGALPADRNAPNSGGELDARVWLDPDRMTHGARLIGELVITRPGIDKAKVQGQVDAFADRLARADEDVQAAFLPIPDDRRTLVSVAGPLGYLADRYGFEVIDQGQVGVRPVAAIVTDPHAPDDATSDVARRAAPGTPTISLDLDSFGAAGSGADTYPALLVTNAKKLGAALAASAGPPAPTTTIG